MNIKYIELASLVVTFNANLFTPPYMHILTVHQRPVGCASCTLSPTPRYKLKTGVLPSPMRRRKRKRKRGRGDVWLH
jgi:hypothetical protein